MPAARMSGRPRRGGIADLPPGYFSLVMATGIVSIAAEMQRRTVVSDVLLWVGVAAFAALGLLNGVRVVRFRHRVLADLDDPRTTFDFFTFVAACGVIGSRLAMGGVSGWALVLWLLALAAWIPFAYVIPAMLTTRSSDYSGGDGTSSLAGAISGNWLLAVVGTQALSVLGAALAWRFDPHLLLFVSLGWWLVGLGLYGGIIILIVLRIVFYRMSPEDFTPGYWISMGALAISVLAGTHLMIHARQLPLLDTVRPVVLLLTIAAWAAGTLWIPFLVLAEVWRLRGHPDPLTYQPDRWGMVFPLGMYSAASYELSIVAHIPELRALATGFFWVSLLAWVVTAGGLIRDLARNARRTHPLPYNQA